jgi:hypothetical protein
LPFFLILEKYFFVLENYFKELVFLKRPLETKIKNFHHHLTPNACDIFKQKISDRKF